MVSLFFMRKNHNCTQRNKKAAELSSAAKYFVERETRFELATRGLGSRCSTTELHPHDH